MKLHLKILEDGTLTLSPHHRVYLSKFHGKDFVGEVEKSKRSLSQNAYMWVYLEIVAKETGNMSEDLHYYFKSSLLPKVIVKIKGRKGVYEIEKLASTTKLDKLQFGEYLEKICAITGVPLPDPAEAGYFVG